MRLREETEFRPKPMVEIGGIPILLHIMRRYIHYGFNDFILLLGHYGSQIKDYFLNYRAHNSDFTIECGTCDDPVITHYGNDEKYFRVTLADTGEDAPTGGRIRQGIKYLEDDQLFMVTYGDGLADIDIYKLLAFHEWHQKLATISITKSSSRFGMVKTGLLDNVVDFTEKPADGWINIGYMVFNRKVIDYIVPDDMLEQAPMKLLVADEQLMAYKHTGEFQQMDTYREYLKLNEIWREGKAFWLC